MTNSSNKSHHRNSFRIIAGKWRSRKLSFPETVESLRPTTDRVRETVFNWLQQKITGAVCLDLFSGSGAFSFEACSRLADSVIAIDNSAAVTSKLIENCKILECHNLEVITANSLQWLDQHAGQCQFDIVFLDPPFTENILEQCCEKLASGNYLRPGARIYLESSSSLDVLNLPESWQLLKQKKAGQVHFGVCEQIIL